MTYYDEFGVSPSASTDEIREAYRQLAKLLHPDTIHNERQRVVAECQMRRLNQVYETLIDPERRWSYDLGMRSPHGVSAPAPRVIPSFKLDPVFLWPLTGLLALLTAFLLSWAETSAKKDRASTLRARTLQSAVCAAEMPPQAAPKQAEPGKELAQMRREAALLAGERDRALSRLAATEASLREMQSLLLESSRPSAVVPASIIPHEAGAQIKSLPRDSVTEVDGIYVPPNHDSPLAGVWYYAKAGKETGTRELYPPEFIEATIVEESGMMRGRYRARYRVTDPAISPDVSFSFSGQAGDSAARFPWLGAEGARGEVRFRLLTPNTLEVAWIANRLGTGLGLGSGKAVLLRKTDR